VTSSPPPIGTKQTEIIDRYRTLVAMVSGPDLATKSKDPPLARLQATITGISPLEGKAGATVTIKGTDLTPASAVVFGDKTAVPKDLGNGDLTADVPSGLTAGGRKTKVRIAVVTQLGTVFGPDQFEAQ
jgi:hypothetical protein